MTYPVDLLHDIDSVLLLFASGFGGINDGCHVREAGIAQVTAVDTDAVTLAAMEAEYPDHWEFEQMDAFGLCRYTTRRWQLVSADLPSSMPLEMVDRLPLFTRVAERYVVSTVCRHNFPGEVSLEELPAAPEGWRYRQLVRRSDYRGGIWWLVSERL